MVVEVYVDIDIDVDMTISVNDNDMNSDVDVVDGDVDVDVDVDSDVVVRKRLFILEPKFALEAAVQGGLSQATLGRFTKNVSKYIETRSEA